MSKTPQDQADAVVSILVWSAMFIIVIAGGTALTAVIDVLSR